MVFEDDAEMYVKNLVNVLSETTELDTFAIHAAYEAGISQYITIDPMSSDTFLEP